MLSDTYRGTAVAAFILAFAGILLASTHDPFAADQQPVGVLDIHCHDTAFQNVAEEIGLTVI